MIKKEEYEKFIKELLYFCGLENAKERAYRESFGRHPDDFIKYIEMKNSFGRADAYEQVMYRIKCFLERSK